MGSESESSSEDEVFGPRKGSIGQSHGRRSRGFGLTNSIRIIASSVTMSGRDPHHFFVVFNFIHRVQNSNPVELLLVSRGWHLVGGSINVEHNLVVPHLLPW